MVRVLLLLLGQVPIVVRPPEIARVAGMTIGLTTLERYDERVGRGYRHMGGHSGGASSWYDLAHHTLIDTDGFNLSRDGEVLEGVYVEWGSSSAYGKAIPRIRLAHRGIGLLAKLHRNMSIRDVERALRLRLADGEATHPGLIRYSKKLINKEDDRYTQWRLRCSFGPKGLEGFAVSCD